jgi:hypothetical protein
MALPGGNLRAAAAMSRSCVAPSPVCKAASASGTMWAASDSSRPAAMARSSAPKGASEPGKVTSSPIVDPAARAAAKKELAASLHTMELEAQGVRAGDQREMLEALAAEIAKAGGKRLWG